MTILEMTVSAGVMILIITVIRVIAIDRLPKRLFEIKGEMPNEETKAAIEEVKRMKADPSIGKSYATVEEMMEDLLS